MKSTQRDTRETVRRLAAESMAAHVITTRRELTWRCAAPQSWYYGFYLAIVPGAVVITGDIGEAMFRMNFGEQEGMKWLLSHIPDEWDYMLGKLYHRESFRTFYIDDAVASLRDCEYHTEADEAQELVDAGHLHHASEWYEFVSDHDLALDFITAGDGWSASAFWMIEALNTFVRLYSTAPQPPVPSVTTAVDPWVS